MVDRNRSSSRGARRTQPRRSSSGDGNRNRSTSSTSSTSSTRGSNRTRTRGSRQSGGGDQRTGTTGQSSFLGRAGRDQAGRERENIARRREANRNRIYLPFRFWMPPNSEREIILLDQHIEFYRYEHALFNQQTGRNDLFVPCVNQQDGCAVCHNGDNAYYAMFLSVIDTEGYENNRHEWVEWSRKMFVIKSGMQNKWIRLEDRHAEGDAGLYGARIRVIRDGDKDPRSGNDIEFMDFEADDVMDSYVREYQDRDNNWKDEDCRNAYDYVALMPEITEEEAAEQAGVDIAPRTGTRTGRPSRESNRGPTPGSRAEEEQAFDEADDVPFEHDNEEQEWDRDRGDEETTSQNDRSSERSDRGSAPRRAQDDDRGEPAEEQEEERPRRGSRGGRPRAGSSGSRAHRDGNETQEADAQEADAQGTERERPTASRRVSRRRGR